MATIQIILCSKPIGADGPCRRSQVVGPKPIGADGPCRRSQVVGPPNQVWVAQGANEKGRAAHYVPVVQLGGVA
jgi:hypothetical protein